MLEREARVGRVEGESVADMLALKSEQLGLGPGDGPRGTGELLRAGCLLLEAVAGTVEAVPPRLACPRCQWVVRGPVTLPCGHTACRGCLGAECLECGGQVPAGVEQNVLVKAAVEKWWPQELEAQRLRDRGLQLAADNSLEEALRAYTSGLEICEYIPLYLYAQEI